MRRTDGIDKSSASASWARAFRAYSLHPSRLLDAWRIRRTAGAVLDELPAARWFGRRGPTVVAFRSLASVRWASTRDVTVIVAEETRLPRRGAHMLASVLDDPAVDAVHGDYAHATRDGQLNVHTPTWSPHLLAAGPYIGGAIAMRTSLARSLAARSPDSFHELVLELSEVTSRVRRVPVVLSASRTPLAARADAAAAVTHLRRRHAVVSASQTPSSPFLTLRLEPSSAPHVGVVVPTRFRGWAVRDLVRNLQGQRLVKVDVVVVDHRSEGETRDCLEELARQGTTVVRDDGEFNFSRLVNSGIERVEAPLTLVLNDDVAPGHPRWLDQLAANLDDPAIGAVGPMLIFPDGSIQHAGVVVGLSGAAGHSFLGRAPEDDGYIGWSRARRDVSAVTGACLMARTRQLRELGCFDEAMRVDLQDVDLCLRIRRDLGLAVVVDPTYPLVHDASASRGEGAADPRDVAVFLERWSDVAADDPFYSPRLSTVTPGY